MQLQPFVVQIQQQLRAAASLGDDRARQTAEVLAAASEPALRLAVLAAVTAAADEITAGLLDTPTAPTVGVSLDGDDLRIEVRTTAAAPAEGGSAADDAEANARISLRLSDALKAEIDAAARAAAVSVNTWLVRTAAGAVDARRPGPHRHGPGRPWSADIGRSGNHITGWING